MCLNFLSAAAAALSAAVTSQGTLYILLIKETSVDPTEIVQSCQMPHGYACTLMVSCSWKKKGGSTTPWENVKSFTLYEKKKGRGAGGPFILGQVYEIFLKLLPWGGRCLDVCETLQTLLHTEGSFEGASLTGMLVRRKGNVCTYNLCLLGTCQILNLLIGER